MGNRLAVLTAENVDLIVEEMLRWILLEDFIVLEKAVVVGDGHSQGGGVYVAMG